MNKKTLSVFGIIAPLAYTSFVIIGGAITPGYSHASQAISELTAVGTPQKLLLDFLFSAYNIMLMIFGISALFEIRRKQTPNRSGEAGSLCLITVGAMGLLTNLFFPMDPRGAPATMPGTIHLILAGLLSLGTILATLLTGLWMIKQPGKKSFGMISLVACAVIIVTGGFAAGAAATVSPWMGLLQRMTIGTFMLWVFLYGISLTFKACKEPTP